MKATCPFTLQSTGLAHLGGLARLHLPFGSPFELKSGFGF
ncbi:hypothetical protein CI1B_43980 [Bradyrhizobium ivorense]|uniref:Uncharacterized protein n=1 Tax=Bradyrhizobium ivorense TaxID=2511166 RepID=A0A508TEA1_9BRAD|nr:hypothetical protein CI1B_43980 [Bradyrhizobium ivorense]